MKKKIKLFSTLAILCLSLAVMVVGVFSALTVTHLKCGIKSCIFTFLKIFKYFVVKFDNLCLLKVSLYWNIKGVFYEKED